MSDRQWQGGERDFSERERRKLAFQGRLLAGVMRAWGATWRVDGSPADILPVRESSPTGGIVFTTWHNRMIMLSYLHRDMRMQALRSSSRDGLLIAGMLKHFGFGAPAGSSSRGGASGLRKLVTCARRGLDIAVTVDGPRGPRGIVKPGALQVAALSGNPIVPFTTAVDREHIFRSWDRTVLAWPFSKIRLRYGDPIMVPRGLNNAEMEELRLEVEASLTRLVDSNDIAMGMTPISAVRDDKGGE
ncbi:MAG: lysophospholipid acyltransferase family protein [bacterium]|nr:lysophospholipid acyltransferase family protein [bacterium]